jgi:lipopolysaccharide exporter
VTESPVQLFKNRVNFKGELFASTFTYGLGAFIRFGSSMVLTRILSPGAYGIFAILLSFVFLAELLSDVGLFGLLIRHERGKEIRFVHTLWTIRLIRSIINFLLLYFAAPLIASLYNSPVLTDAFRTLSPWFLISGAESLSFVLAQRDQRARIGNYVDLACATLMTVFVIILAQHLHSHYALIYGLLFQRTLLTLASHCFYRNIGVGIAFDRAAIADQFGFARIVLPSSLLTILLSQYDKLVLLKLFNLSVLGVYGLAANMIGPVTGIIVHNARVVLYARCAHYFRENRATAMQRYYRENRMLLLVGILLPALVAGGAQVVVQFCYDARYEMAGPVLAILGLGGILYASQNASENLLVAAGRTHMVLAANIIRIVSVPACTSLGYFLFGFYGFLWFGVIAAIPVTVYMYYVQYRDGLLRLRKELELYALAVAAFAVAYGVARLILLVVPPQWLHLGMIRQHLHGP